MGEEVGPVAGALVPLGSIVGVLEGKLSNNSVDTRAQYKSSSSCIRSFATATTGTTSHTKEAAANTTTNDRINIVVFFQQFSQMMQIVAYPLFGLGNRVVATERGEGRGVKLGLDGELSVRF